MPPSPSPHALNLRRQHNTLLLRKVLEARAGASPFTLVLDSVGQSAKGLVGLCVEAAKASKADVVFVSYETLKAPVGVDKVVKARRKAPERVRGEIEGLVDRRRRTLLIIDTLYPLATTPNSLPPFLTSLLSPSPALSLLAIYHTDIPLPSPNPSSPTPSSSSPPQTQTQSPSPYSPLPLPLLTYLATTILTLHNPTHLLSRIRAREKCIPDPLFGLEEGREGVVVGMRGDAGAGAGTAVGDEGAFVLEMEYRRKSGRGVGEWFFVEGMKAGEGEAVAQKAGDVSLLDDHRLFSGREGVGVGEGAVGHEGGTFELGLTEKQRGQREGVVLPYFDAQKGEGGAGGRILYDFGVEDDFDEEEDEI